METVIMKEQLLSVKIKESTYRMVKTIASWNGEGFAECLSRMVDPVAEKELEKVGKSTPPKKRRRDNE